MAISTAMCTSFKRQLLEGVHDFRTTGNLFKMALYTSTATLDAGTTAYSATNEITGTGYTATGNALTNVNPTTSGTTAFTDFNDTQWTGATFTANGALIYNDTATGDPSVSTHAFGGDQSVTSGTFTVQFPAAAAATAIIRL